MSQVSQVYVRLQNTETSGAKGKQVVIKQFSAELISFSCEACKTLSDKVLLSV